MQIKIAKLLQEQAENLNSQPQAEPAPPPKEPDAPALSGDTPQPPPAEPEAGQATRSDTPAEPANRATLPLPFPYGSRADLSQGTGFSGEG